MLWNMGSIAPYHMGSSQTGDGTRVSCTGRPILIHWASREAPRLNSHCTFCLVSDPISFLQAVSLQWGKCWSRWLNSGSGPLMGSDICFSPSNYQFLPLYPCWFICEETQSPDWSLWKGDRWPLLLLAFPLWALCGRAYAEPRPVQSESCSMLTEPVVLRIGMTE